mmetsp:Transcript_44960/g.66161  ORF Transcript_44960/g.66161 Transcript_44960/m.66161 type:complete len:154 (-) Transcript_44960:965-1426(-)
MSVPRHRRNGALLSLRLAGSIERRCRIASCNSTNDGQRERDKQVDGEQHHDGAKWQSSGRAVRPSDSVEEAPQDGKRSWHQKGGDDNVPRPLFSVDLAVQPSRKVSTDSRAQSIGADDALQHGATASRVDNLHQAEQGGDQKRDHEVKPNANR